MLVLVLVCVCIALVSHSNHSALPHFCQLAQQQTWSRKGSRKQRPETTAENRTEDDSQARKGRERERASFDEEHTSAASISRAEFRADKVAGAGANLMIGNAAVAAAAAADGQ